MWPGGWNASGDIAVGGMRSFGRDGPVLQFLRDKFDRTLGRCAETARTRGDHFNNIALANLAGALGRWPIPIEIVDIATTAVHAAIQAPGLGAHAGPARTNPAGIFDAVDAP